MFEPVASAAGTFRFKAKLLEVASVGGFSLRQNGHGFTVGLRPNPEEQVVEITPRSSRALTLVSWIKAREE